MKHTELSTGALYAVRALYAIRKRIRRFSIFSLVVIAMFIVGSFLLGYSFATLATIVKAQSANLVQNGDMEIAGSGGSPQGWIKGRWGSNTAVFTYPVLGNGGGQGARVALSGYASGDAKWAFSPVPISGGQTYRYSDSYTATVGTFVTAQFTLDNGSVIYRDLLAPPPASSFTGASVEFVAPANATTMTVFHLIKANGTLTIDDVSVVAVSSDPGNMIRNPSVESGVSGAPDHWKKGRWGTNTVNFSYPVAGYDGSRAVRIDMTSRATGDAKWYFDRIPTTSGTTYAYQDRSRSNVTTYLTVEYQRSDGSFFYSDLGAIPPSSGWALNERTFTVPSGAVSFSVYHVIKNVGWMEADAYMLRPSGGGGPPPPPPPPPPSDRFDKGYVSIHFDDGWRSTVDIALPMLEAAGFKSTHYIVTERMYEGDFPGFIKTDEISDLAALGHEVSAHTRTHPSLTSLTSAELQSEVAGSRTDLLDIGISPVDTFAYPFGNYNSQVVQAVRNAGYKGARSSDGGYNLKTQDPFVLKRQPMTNQTTFADIKRYIDTAMAERTWVILLFHEVEDNGHTYSVSPALFQDMVDYLRSRGITPITTRQGIDLMDD